ncbi:hypothetical protein CRG98_020188 [Punica granatum]|uniref:Uncharacterized protein n=1 Tax=Punica granatum TaxID=22663 RepID=A0A2I0JSY4_PUNGR|nr:hypothetical protein CRG98_020188 [Punica granatum]
MVRSRFHNSQFFLQLKSKGHAAHERENHLHTVDIAAGAYLVYVYKHDGQQGRTVKSQAIRIDLVRGLTLANLLHAGGGGRRRQRLGLTIESEDEGVGVKGVSSITPSSIDERGKVMMGKPNGFKTETARKIIIQIREKPNKDRALLETERESCEISVVVSTHRKISPDEPPGQNHAGVAWPASLCGSPGMSVGNTQV